MTRVIKPPYQLIEFTGGGLAIGGYAQLRGFLPPVTLLKAIGGLRLGGRTSALMPVGDRGGLRIGGRSRVLSLIGQYSPALARFGSTVGMTEVVNSPNSQGSQYLPDIGFPFPLYGTTYQSNIAISSNWALLFGFNLLAATDISRSVPGRAFLMAASRARSWDRVLVKADNSFSYRIRFEAQISFGFRPTYNTFEVTLYSDGSIQLVCGTSFDFNGSFGDPRVKSLTKGDNVSYADFNLPSGYYDNYPDTDSVNAGVVASFVFTPDDTAANSHTVRIGSYPALAPKISRGGLLLGGRSVAVPPISDTIASIGGLRIGGRTFIQPKTGTYSPAVAVMGGRSGMTQIVSSYADDASQYLPDIGFPFPLYGTYYQSNISICSNSYLLFGALLTDTYFSHNYPGRGLFVGARDGSWQNIYVKADSANAYRIRFEGRHNYSSTGATFIFEVTLFSDGAIQLVLGAGYDRGFYPSESFRSLSKGDGVSYADYPYTSGGIALSGFTDDSVLASFVFTPDEATRTSHTVQTGSYSRNGVPPAPIPSTALGGLRLGGISKVIPPKAAIGGLLLGGIAKVVPPKTAIGGLRLGGRSVIGTAINPLRSFGGLRLGGVAKVTLPQASIGGLRLGGRSSIVAVGARVFSSAIATLQDNTGMTQVASSFADDASQYLPDVGFDFPIYGSTYRSNIAIGSNWYLLFGLTSGAYSGLSRTVPGRGLLFGATDRSWQNVYFKAESGFCRIRFEGYTGSNSATDAATFQIKLFVDGTIELTIGIGSFYNPQTDVKSLTKGDGTTYTDFTVPAGSTIQSGFTSAAVLTSLVFSPVDALGNSHTVATGSYS